MADSTDNQSDQTSQPAEKPRASNLSKFVKIGLGVLVTVVCLAVAFSRVEWDKVRTGFAEADYRSIPVLLGLLFCFFSLKALRWKWLLEPVHKFSVREVVPALMIGFAGNNILPAHLGEFIRVYVLSKDSGVARTPVLSTVVLERIFDVVVILGLLVLSLIFIDNMPEKLALAAKTVAVISGVGVLVLVSYVAFPGQFVGFTRWVLAKFSFVVPAKLADGVVGMLESGVTGLASVKNVRLLSLISLTSVAQWLFNGAMIYVSLWSFNISISPFVALLVMGMLAFAVTVPSTPGYFGVIQLTIMATLEPFMPTDDETTKAAILGASVLYHMAQYIPVTLTGLIFLSMKGLSFGKLKSESESQDSADPAVPA